MNSYKTKTKTSPLRILANIAGFIAISVVFGYTMAGCLGAI